MRNPIQLPLPLPDATVEIELTKGKVTVIDAVDADLANVNWFAQLSWAERYCAGRHDNGKRIYMHRVILERMLGCELKKGEMVDHISGDTLDNRRANLRLATNRQNQQNSRRQINNTSGFKGVSWEDNKKAWRAGITLKKKYKNLGCYETPEEAARAYDAAARKYFGEFARPNFPD